MASPAPIPWRTFVHIAYAILFRRKLSSREESIRTVARYLPTLKVDGLENIPAKGGYVVTNNHYTRPGFGSWWLTVPISSVLPCEVHWITTSAWRKPRWLSPATRWVYPRLARVYGFTPMPPMPPDPAETAARAAAIREVIEYASRNPEPVIGLSPEGGDEEEGVLRWPFPGTGRFMLHLAKLGLSYLPVGVFEEGECVCLRFGPAYQLNVPPGLPNEEKDRCASYIVMSMIARQLPEALRGEWKVNRSHKATSY